MVSAWAPDVPEAAAPDEVADADALPAGAEVVVVSELPTDPHAASTSDVATIALRPMARVFLMNDPPRGVTSTRLLCVVATAP